MEPPAETAAQRAETMRAKLQVDVSKFKELVKEVGEQFPFCGKIKETARRGISVPQLQQILKFAELRCSRWRDTWSGKQVDIKCLNLYHLNDWCILPATNAENCAMVELFTGQPQNPRWFCSHWWGEPIQDFIACVQKHASVRQLQQDVFYWVCAYANRQHAVGDELQSDPRQSSFFKAMELSEGVLLILDARAVPFTRVWCAFEEATAIKSDRLVLDIATATGGKDAPVHLLTGSLAGVEKKLKELGDQRSGALVQLLRESTFPVDVLKAGLQLRVQDANATEEEDRLHILNVLTERPLNEMPVEEDEGYDRVNLQLRSTFAIAVWVQVIAQGANEVMPQLQKALREDRWRRKLVMDFTMLRETFTDGYAACFAGGLPEDLETLDLNFQGCKELGDQGLAALGAAIANLRLRELRLDFRNTKAGDAGVAALARGLPRTLETLHMKMFSGHCGSPGLATLAAQLPKTLQKLELDVESFRRVKSDDGVGAGIIPLADALQELPVLQYFGLLGEGRVDAGPEANAAFVKEMAAWSRKQGCTTCRVAEPALLEPATAEAFALRAPAGAAAPRTDEGLQLLKRLQLKPSADLLKKEEFWKALREGLCGSPLVALELLLVHRDVNGAGLAQLIKELPKELVELELSGVGLTGDRLALLAPGLPVGLKQLRLQLGGATFFRTAFEDSDWEALRPHLPKGLVLTQITINGQQRALHS